jgi:hypothetical protein
MEQNVRFEPITRTITKVTGEHYEITPDSYVVF